MLRHATLVALWVVMVSRCVLHCLWQWLGGYLMFTHAERGRGQEGLQEPLPATCTDVTPHVDSCQCQAVSIPWPVQVLGPRPGLRPEHCSTFLHLFWMTGQV